VPPFKVSAVTCLALDGVCGRKDQPGSISHHKGFSAFMDSRSIIGARLLPTLTNFTLAAGLSPV
jgi:hypothetical protein